MNLRKKTFLNLVVVIMAITIMTIIFSSVIILKNYEKLESDRVSKDVNLVVNEINAELSGIKFLADRWGAWDDTCAFIRGEKPDFIQKNFPIDTYSTYDINALIFTNAKGEIVYSQGYNYNTKELEPVVPELLADLASEKSLLMHPPSGSSTDGFFTTSKGPAFIASYPVRYSNFSESSLGRIIIGKYIYGDEIEKYRLKTVPSLTIVSSDSPSIPQNIRPLLTSAGSSSVLVTLESGERVAGYKILNDIYGNNAVLLRIEEPRDIYNQRLATVFDFILIQLAAGLIFGLLIFFLINKNVLSRIQGMNNEFKTIISNGDVSTRIKVKGDDELTRLGEVTNQMLEQIEITQNELKKEEALRESEKKFREIFNKANDAIHLHEVGEDGRPGTFIDVNDIACRMLQYSREEMLQRSPLDFATEYHSRPLDKIFEELRTVGHATFETGHIRKDGTIVPVEINAHMITLFGRNVVLSVVRDITERRQAEEEQKRKTEQLLQTQSALMQITKMPVGDFDEHLHKITEIEAKTLDIERVSIWWLSSDYSEIICADIYDAISGNHTSGDRLKRSDFPRYFQALDENRTLAAADARTDERTAEFTATYLIPLGITAMMDVPIRRSGTVIGIICHEHQGTQRTWGYIEQDFAASVSDHIVSVLEGLERRKAEDALRESEELFREVFDNANDPIFLQEMTAEGPGRYILVNNIATQSLGYTREEFMQMSSRDIELDHFLHDFVVPENMEKLSKDGHATFESLHQRKDGSIYPVEVSAHIFPFKSKHVALSITRDITERKQAQTALKESFATFKTVMDSLDALVYVTDMKTYELLFVNQYGRKRWGDITGKICWKSLQDNQTGPCPFCTNEKLLDSVGNPTGIFTWEFQNTITRRWYECRDSAIQWIDGRNVRLEIATDITERKRAEEALKASERKFRDFFETSRDAVFITSIDGKFVGVNESFVDMFGYDSREEILHKKVAEFYANPDEREKHIRTISELGQTKEYPVNLHKKDGTIINTLISSVPRKNADGKVIGFQGTIRDITDHLRVEKEIHTLNQFQAGIISNANVWLMVLDLKGNIQMWNRAAEDISGYGEQDVKGHSTVWKMLYPDKEYRKNVTKNIERIIGENNYLENLETNIHCKNGTEKSILWNTRSLLDDAGKVTGYVAIGVDITKSVQAEQALRESEGRLRTLLENIPDYVIVHREGKILYLNPACEKGLGYSKEKILNQSILSFIAPEYHEKIIDASRRRIQGEDVEPYEVDICTDDGKCRTVSIHGALINFSGSPASLNVMSDVTERNKAEETRRRLTEFQESVITNAQVWLSVLGKNGKILIWNSAAAEISGYRTDEVIGKNEIWKMIYPEKEYRKQITDTINRIIRDKKYLENFETTIRSKQGDEKVISWNTRGIPDIKGKISNYIVIGVDITAHKRAEEEIHSLNQLQTSIISNANVWLMVLDPKGNIRMWNRAAEDLSGYGEQEVKGNSTVWKNLYPDKEYRKNVTKNIERIISENNYLENFETTIRCKNGTEKNILWNTRSLPDETGKVTGYVAIGVDITERKQAEELQRHFTEELEKQVTSRTEELNSSLKEKILLLREVHHRVKNNLQIIISLVNLQMRQLENPHLKQVMAETQNRVKAMSIVHEKLYQSESLSHIDLAEYIRYLAIQLFSFYGIDTRRVRLDIGIGRFMVDINTAIPVGLVINELVSNALKYAFPADREGTISINGRSDDGTLTLVVKDDGIGMPPDLDWRNSTSLGLRLVTSLVDQLDGTIEHGRGTGTMFIITIRQKQE